MSFASKRKRDAESDTNKKALGEKQRELLAQTEEWPMYAHPDGGTVKMTPWGSLRQWTDPMTGLSHTKFEDASFLDLSFAMSAQNANLQCYDLPSTPMSMNAPSLARSSPSPMDRIHLSPSTEAEQYVIDGYLDKESIARQGNGFGEYQPQFAQEQEHYFGMAEEEEDTSMA